MVPGAVARPTRDCARGARGDNQGSCTDAKADGSLKLTKFKRPKPGLARIFGHIDYAKW
jgi:hypothetical protein